MAVAGPDRIAATTITTRAAPTAAEPRAASPLVIVGDSEDSASGHALAPDVALIVTESGDGCIVDLGGSFYALSPVAAAMLRDTIGGGRDIAITRCAARYGVDVSRIAADLDGFLDDMERRGLLRTRLTRRPLKLGQSLAPVFASAACLALRLTRSPSARAWTALTLARVSFLVSGWSATVRAWRRRLRVAANADGAQRAAIDEAVRTMAARHPMNVDCKERALACFALARAAGLPATLVVGVDFYPLAGHSWCEADDGVIGDEESHTRRFTPAFRLS